MEEEKKSEFENPDTPETCIYGKVQEGSKMYDLKEITKGKMLSYNLSKIKCQIKSSSYIVGIQFFYKDRMDGKEVALIDIAPKGKDYFEQEMDLSAFEIVTNMKVWIRDRLLGFEVTTNKNKSMKFGYGEDTDIYQVPDLKENNMAVVGFGAYADDKDGVTSIYSYFINKKQYAIVLYSGVFNLRLKLKDEAYKKKVEAKLPNLDEKMRVLYKTCILPDNQFYEIIKFALS